MRHDAFGDATTMRTSDIDRLYTRDYYLEDCEGFETFLRKAGIRQAGRESGARTPSRRLSKCLDLVDAFHGARVVDVGCGRGEISAGLAARGATVVALDPSAAALNILGESAPTGTVLPVRALGEELPIRDSWADALVLSDVVEHVDPPRLPRLLEECARVLKPDGKVVIHTQPNRVLVSWTVPLLARVARLWGVRLPRDLRSEAGPGSGVEYHRNELSAPALRRAVRRAGLVVEELWLEGSWAVHRIFGNGRLKDVVLRRFRRSAILKHLLATQVYCTARKPLCRRPADGVARRP